MTQGVRVAMVISILSMGGPILNAAGTNGAEQAVVPLGPANATWHVGLSGLWRSGKQDRRLDIYATFKDGKWVNALGSARFYNKSMHFIQQSSVTLDPGSGSVTGALKVLITPDLFVPADGQAYVLLVDVNGKLTNAAGKWGLGGVYNVRREDGKQMPERTNSTEGVLIGGAGPTETGWEDSVWRIQMNQTGAPDDIDLDALDLTLGIADGKVQ